ncbi:50S ribosomal protein L9 [Aquihabitans sp. G128]|uniref:50S ribosomal protein L9 n=1 Tax=Aquihabitans sp. G128 TaxID=2849779 RepID=UPI001C2398DC|nr:50S ribosomal protein L9 [Aquihabitans sp. G128]QXC59856.1 50S ribosomal protein L9 [Aquihabitans sp. G128]
MRLILRSDVSGVGNKGDVVEVTNGYGRNFLLPRGLAFVATAGAESQAEGMRKSRDVKDAAARQAAEEVAKKLVNSPVTIPARVGAEDKLFGSVTSADVVEAILAQKDVEIDRKQVQLHDPIRTIGTHMVPIKLHANVEFPVTVEVVSDAD